MSIEMQSQTISRDQQQTFVFDGNVKNAVAVVQGYDVSFGGDDHHVKDLKVEATILKTNANTVTVQATCNMDDDTGHHASSGDITVACIADVETKH